MWSRKRALSEKNERVDGRTAGLLVHNVTIALISQEEKNNIGDLARINAAHSRGAVSQANGGTEMQSDQSAFGVSGTTPSVGEYTELVVCIEVRIARSSATMGVVSKAAMRERRAPPGRAVPALEAELERERERRAVETDDFRDRVVRSANGLC
jgi:hypothetical protein